MYNCVNVTEHKINTKIVLYSIKNLENLVFNKKYVVFKKVFELNQCISYL